MDPRKNSFGMEQKQNQQKKHAKISKLKFDKKSCQYDDNCNSNIISTIPKITNSNSNNSNSSNINNNNNNNINSNNNNNNNNNNNRLTSIALFNPYCGYLVLI